ncbi:MAG TPA: glycoside hydrolase family 130 protein [Chitinophagaceae bacterium]|nr:glycoside hydrolase family 130 protein [Chitinophagaceae bacterium]
MRYLLALSLGVLVAGCARQAKTGEHPSAPAWALVPFEKVDSLNPILNPDTAASFTCPVRGQRVHWEEKDVFNPAALVRKDTVFLLYRAEDSIGKYAGTSRIGLAWSLDGLHFNRLPAPVLYPDQDSVKRYEWEGGCEDPRVVEDSSGTYIMTYTGYDGDKARLLVATSRDLRHWTKYGPAFPGKYVNTWSKSGSIVCRYRDGKAVAVRIAGRYWMYWGDTNIFLASSPDLIHWTPAENPDGSLLVVFGPRPGKFDSDLVESGPPARLDSAGIVLIYNSRNVPSKGDSSLPEGTYAASQVLLDSTRPGRVLDRMTTYFIAPEKPYEISGQVNQVCFLEGMVHFRGHWFLYYGTADSKIAVAVK